jgi:hypothetical protein
VSWLPLVASLAVAAVVFDLVRRRRLREEFSWLWVLGTVGALALTLVPPARDLLARALGTTSESASLAVALLFVVAVLLDVSTKVSTLANQQKNLAQNVARLDKRLADLEEPDADER